jgi:signal peptidase I
MVNGNNIVEPNIHNPTYPFEGYIEYPLTLKEGECFVLCDARNGTEDSRYFGPVSKKSIKGTVIAVLRRYSL